MNESIIYTEIFNCGSVAKKCLETFFKYHDRVVHVFGSKADFEQCLQHPNIIPIIYEGIQEKFERGHAGTAFIFATAYTRWKGRNVIRFDSDVLFKQECISIMDNAFAEGYDLIGSRRCYKNNPVNIEVPDDIPDSLSTYFLGINTAKIPTYDFETFCRMWQGAYHPWNWIILDFGDPVIHSTMNNGGKILYVDPNLIGGQNEFGKKINNYTSNMHLDCGKWLMHFGGVGSGCAIHAGKSYPEKSYRDWALQRFELWEKIMYNKEWITHSANPVFDDDGRWISGGYNDELLRIIIDDLTK